jgi:hypothetical protein
VPFEPRRRRTVPVLGAVAAIAAVAALALGIWGSSVSSDLDETRAALARERQGAALVADPGSRTVDLASGAGRLVVGQDGRAALVLSDLGEAPTGKTYQAWIIEDDNPISGGHLPGQAGMDARPARRRRGRRRGRRRDGRAAGGAATPLATADRRLGPRLNGLFAGRSPSQS